MHPHHLGTFPTWYRELHRNNEVTKPILDYLHGPNLTASRGSRERSLSGVRLVWQKNSGPKHGRSGMLLLGDDGAGVAWQGMQARLPAEDRKTEPSVQPAHRTELCQQPEWARSAFPCPQPWTHQVWSSSWSTPCFWLGAEERAESTCTVDPPTQLWDDELYFY